MKGTQNEQICPSELLAVETLKPYRLARRGAASRDY